MQRFHLSLSALLRALAYAYIGIASSLAAAQPEGESLERRIKAAFLYKFVSYVQWPEGAFSRPDSPLNIGIIGDDQIANDLALLTLGRTMEGRSIVIRKLKEIDTLPLHVLFIGRAEQPRFAQLVKGIQSRPTLIVSETESALQQGSMINFVVASGKVRFEISLENAEKMALRLSSRLLAVAQNVRTGIP